eukprot:Platyproteum_vivax@DN7216_c0_g1_i1.p2
MSLSCLFAKRRAYLFLGGILSSITMFMLIAGLANVFFRSRLIFSIELYGGLAVFALYIVFDTQMMVEQFESGNQDPMKSAAQMYMNLVAIFMRMLMENQDSANRREIQIKEEKQKD